MIGVTDMVGDMDGGIIIGVIVMVGVIVRVSHGQDHSRGCGQGWWHHHQSS